MDKELTLKQRIALKLLLLAVRLVTDYSIKEEIFKVEKELNT